jgi:hypothetical protein
MRSPPEFHHVDVERDRVSDSHGDVVSVSYTEVYPLFLHRKWFCAGVVTWVNSLLINNSSNRPVFCIDSESPSRENGRIYSTDFPKLYVPFVVDPADDQTDLVGAAREHDAVVMVSIRDRNDVPVPFLNDLVGCGRDYVFPSFLVCFLESRWCADLDQFPKRFAVFVVHIEEKTQE